jgi:hypothetical protein
VRFIDIIDVYQVTQPRRTRLTATTDKAAHERKLGPHRRILPSNSYNIYVHARDMGPLMHIASTRNIITVY